MLHPKIVDQVWNNLPFKETKQRLSLIINTFLEETGKTLLEDKQLKLRNFGTFSVKKSPSLRKKLPGSDSVKTFPGKYNVRFKPSSKLSALLNK
jgi:nucleoid DNA-binding protein